MKNNQGAYMASSCLYGIKEIKVAIWPCDTAKESRDENMMHLISLLLLKFANE